MGLTYSVNGHLATSLRVTLPEWGTWYAEASLDGEHTLTGRCTIAMADLTLQGVVLSGGPDKGRSFYRIAGGRGVWAKELAAKSYQDDGGVRLATVLADVAAETAEVFDAATVGTRRLGSSFVRPRGPASRVLELVAPGAWHVGEDGITRLGKRAAGKLPSDATLGVFDRARNTVEVSSDAIKTILPGVVVEGVRAVDVVHESNAERGLRSQIFGVGISATSRTLAAWRKMLDAIDPWRLFRGVVEYRVVTQSGKRLSLQPVRTSSGMPQLERVPVWPGVSGCDADVLPGSRVLVGFIDSDPTRPYVCALEDADGQGFKPLMLRLDAVTLVRLGAGALPVARAGDIAGIFPIVPTQVKVLA